MIIQQKNYYEQQIWFAIPNENLIGYRFINSKNENPPIFDSFEDSDIYLFADVNLYRKNFSLDISEDEFGLCFNNIEVFFEVLEDQEYFGAYSRESVEKRLRFSRET